MVKARQLCHFKEENSFATSGGPGSSSHLGQGSASHLGGRGGVLDLNEVDSTQMESDGIYEDLDAVRK